MARARRAAPWALGLAAGLSLLLPRPAFAEAPDLGCADTDPVACGRKQFQLGTEAHDRGDYQLAVRAFQAALATKPHPVIRFDLALSLIQLGRLREARAALSAVRADPVTDAGLRARAEQEEKRLTANIAHLRIAVRDARTLQVALDGNPVELSGGELELDPGSHRIAVDSEGASVYDQTLEVHPGERIELRVDQGRVRDIDVVLVPRAAPPPGTLSASTAAGGPAADPHAHGLRPIWFWSGIGATAVLGGLTVWSALDTQSAYDDYEHDRPRLDQAQADARVESGHRRELRTNLLLGGTLCAGAASAVLGIWLVDFGGVHAQAGMDPRGLFLRARF